MIISGFFAIFYRNYLSNRQNIIKFVISGSELVEIDTSLARFQKFYFWRPFWFFSKTRFSIMAEVTDRFCWFSIANIGRQLCTLCSILKKIGAKLRPWECRNEKRTKWPPWRHPFWIFKIREKCHWQISSRSFVESFIKIDQSVWAVEMTHTHRQTHRQNPYYFVVLI